MLGGILRRDRQHLQGHGLRGDPHAGAPQPAAALQAHAAGDAVGWVNCLHAAAALSPRSATHAAELGRGYEAVGQLDTAVTHFARAAQLRPAWHRAYFRLGHAYGRLERMEPARQNFELALRIAPADTETHRLLAVTHSMSGQPSRTAGEATAGRVF